MHEVDGSKLKDIRKRANLNQEEIGQRIGKSSKDVSHYENGRAKPSGDTLLNYLIEFNTRPIEIAKKV